MRVWGRGAFSAFPKAPIDNQCWRPVDVVGCICMYMCNKALNRKTPCVKFPDPSHKGC